MNESVHGGEAPDTDRPSAHGVFDEESDQESDQGVAPCNAQRVEMLRQVLGRHVCEDLGIYRLPNDFLLSVVIPVFNEHSTVETVVERVQQTNIPSEIILVDDGSTDGTGELLESWRGRENMVILRHDRNRGKGAALRIAFKEARGDVVVIQDADLEYNPNEYWKLIQPMVTGRADVVYGSRFRGSPQRALYFWHFVGNRIITLLSNLSTGLNLSDVETCYKLIRRDVLRQITPTLREDGFGIELELTAKFAKIPGIRIFDLPISYDGRTYQEGKKVSWRDGIYAVWCILRY